MKINESDPIDLYAYVGGNPIRYIEIRYSYFLSTFLFDLSPALTKKIDKRKNTKQIIPAIYGCLHLKFSWNKLNSLLQKPLAKLPEEKNHIREYKKTTKLQPPRKYNIFELITFI
jgi:hypothetical protein